MKTLSDKLTLGQRYLKTPATLLGFAGNQGLQEIKESNAKRR